MLKRKFILVPHPTSKELSQDKEVHCSVIQKGAQFEIEFEYVSLIATSPLEFVDTTKDGFNGELWKKSCFEFFIRDSKSGRYWEWNFVPSGSWGAFVFESERKRAFEKDNLTEAAPFYIKYQEELKGDKKIIKLYTGIDLAFSNFLCWNFNNSSLVNDLEISCNMISTHVNNKPIFWAIRHPELDRADFHNVKAFVLWQ